MFYNYVVMYGRMLELLATVTSEEWGWGPRGAGGLTLLSSDALLERTQPIS